MERLTKRIKDAAVCRDCTGTCGTCDGADCFDVQPMVDRLADYEDAEEQGLLVRLPCKVGDMVYRVWFTEGRKPEITTHKMERLIDIVQWLDKFGKTVFLTCEEAEAALKEEHDGN